MYGETMPFGKYKGKPLGEVPGDYLEWVLKNCTRTSAYLRGAIQRELHSRATSPASSISGIIVARWYREMSLRFHPDRGGSHEAMVAVNACYERLKELLNDT